MFNIKNIGRNFFLFFFLPFSISIGILFFLEGSSYHGTHTITYNLNPISIKRDEYAVPTIESQTLKDAIYGLGFAHAQDRLWTVFFRKLLFSGRLSEFFGPSTFSLDKFMRSVSLVRYSYYSMAYIDPEMQELLQAYVDGFNEAVDTMKVLPLEFWITQTKYEPLTVIDVVTAAKGISFFLAFGYQSETIYATLENILGAERVREIMPREEELLLWNNVTVLNDEDLKQNNLFEPFDKNRRFEAPKGQEFPKERKAPDGTKSVSLPTAESFINTGDSHYKGPNSESVSGEIERLTRSVEISGSNAWVIHGNHTTTGKPILANDPHLANGIPSFWYNAALVYGDNCVTGVSVAGLPMILIGKTNHVAWGFTANMMDSGDLYNITVEDDKYYLYEDKWYPLEEFDEPIRIKSGLEQPYKVYETHHGVIIDPYFMEFFGKKGHKVDPSKKYALAWMGFTHKETTLNSFHKLLDVKTADEMISIWEGSLQFVMNLHFATMSGDIGFMVLGRIPIRKSTGNGGKPLDGSKAENDWVGWVPWKDQPRIINPAKGFIVSANNKIATNNLKWQVSATMFYTSRAVRIQEMITEIINSERKISVDDVKKMQLDTIDILARDAVPVIIGCAKKALSLGYNASDNGAKVHKVLELLEGWNFDVTKESIPATIFLVWEVKFLSKMLRNFNMTEEARLTLNEEILIVNFVYKRLLEWSSPEKTLVDEYWCRSSDNIDEKYPCLYNLVESLEEAWTYLEKRLGGSPNDWQWERLHREDYSHTPLSQTILKRLFHRYVPSSGNGRTVKVSVMKQSKAGYDSVWSPNMRMVMSVGEEDNSYAIIDTGISGRPHSSHYTDQMTAYHEGKWLKMAEGRKKHWVNKLDLNFRR